jgi:hypothetical protein
MHGAGEELGETRRRTFVAKESFSLLLCLLLLTGCSETEKLKASIKSMEDGCETPLRVEFRYSFWSRDLIVTCEKMRRGQWTK